MADRDRHSVPPEEMSRPKALMEVLWVTFYAVIASAQSESGIDLLVGMQYIKNVPDNYSVLTQ